MAERGDLPVLHEPFCNLKDYGETDAGGRTFDSAAELLAWLHCEGHDRDVFFKDTMDHQHDAVLPLATLRGARPGRVFQGHDGPPARCGPAPGYIARGTTGTCFSRTRWTTSTMRSCPWLHCEGHDRDVFFKDTMDHQHDAVLPLATLRGARPGRVFQGHDGPPARCGPAPGYIARGTTGTCFSRTRWTTSTMRS